MLLRTALALLRALFRSRAELALENLTLRHQLMVLRRSVKRPRLRQSDRLFWISLSRGWKGWCPSLVLVKPETVVRWHRKDFKLFWKWKSRPRRPAPPTLPREIINLIRRMASETVGVPVLLDSDSFIGVRSDVRGIEPRLSGDMPVGG